MDKEIEQILGRAIDGKDLKMLYELDIKTLNQLNTGCNGKFDGFVQHFASVTIQRHFKGFAVRKEVAVTKFMRKRFARLLEPFVKNFLKEKRVKAAIRIQRMFRRFRQRKI